MSIDLIFGVGLFCGIVLLLVLVIIAARSKLVATGDVLSLIHISEPTRPY